MSFQAILRFSMRFPRAALPVILAIAMCAAQQPPAVYTPHYHGDPAHSQAEAVALGYMHTLVYAQKLYLKKHGKYATSLYALVGSGSFTKRMANPDRGDYTVSFHGGETKYAVQLTPRTFDAGHRAFWTNQNGIEHVEVDKPATEDSPVLKPDSLG